MMTTKIRVAAAIALLASIAPPLAAHATPVTIDFNVTSTVANNGYGAGILGSGYFTFDDALIPASGNGNIGNSIMGAPTLDLSFNWFGASFDATNAGIATLTFANGSLTDWWIGGNYVAPVCGPMRYSCVSSVGAAPDFMLLASSGGSLNDGVNSGIGSGYGTVSWSVRSTSVPEPAMLGLFGLGLLGLAAAQRKKVA
jgi:hypothetical protein